MISGGLHHKRAVEMYDELGFEVFLEEVNPEDCGQCTACYVAGNEAMYRVYTRESGGKKQTSQPETG